MLNIGSTAKPFKPREDSMLALQTDLYADPVTGANADTVYERDGQYFKSKKWQGLTLDGNLGWLLSSGFAGYKEVRVPLASVGTENAYAQKYDGKILTNRKGSAVSAGDQFSLNDNSNVYLSISVADSGWADSYGPDQNDIKAYFYGYKAYDANTITPANAQTMTTATWTGTGTKYWVQRVGAPNFTQSVPTQSYAGYTPYQLVYQLATPTVEPIVSEGQLTFVEGDNQVEVGTGIVLREAANPAPYYNGEPNRNRWALNKLTSGPPNPFKNLPRKALQVYGNGFSEAFNAGTTGDLSNWYGGVYIDQLYAYAPEKSYSVTYLMAATSPVVPFTGSYAANEKTLLADLVDGVQQNTARVSVLENKKADKDNPVWLYPTLLNGWVDYDTARRPIAYYKDSMGWVHVQGYIKNGVSTANSVIYRFPKGYEPESPIEVAAVSSSGAGAAPSTLYVGSTSLQCNSSVGNSFLVIDFSYRAK
jgi:hypothetical protein